jgi:signal peptidase II
VAPSNASPAPVAGTDHAGEGGPPASTRVGSGLSGAGRSRWVLFFGLAATIFVVDQLLKSWIVSQYDVNVAVPIVGDSVRIWLSHNTGALFGLFRDQALIFAAFSLGVIGIIVWYEARAGRSLLVTLALGLLLGGALGNLADRLRLGYVVDFMDIGIGTWRWYTFNVADAAISGAVLLLVLVALVPSLAVAARDA